MKNEPIPQTRHSLRQHEMIAPGAGSAELLTRSPARNKASAADLAPPGRPPRQPAGPGLPQPHRQPPASPGWAGD